MTTNRLTDEQQMQVMRLLNSGMSRAALAQAYSVSKDTIDRIWQKYGITPYEPTTLGVRLEALNIKLDRVLAETMQDISRHRMPS